MQGIARAIGREVREALPATVFFLLLFHLVSLTKAVAIEDYSITALRATASTLGALLVAKAILVVEALPIGRRFSGRLIASVVWKTALFALVVLLFRFLEEWIPLVWHHGFTGKAVEALVEEVSWPLFWVVGLWVLWGLFLYTLAAEYVRQGRSDERASQRTG